MRVELCRAASRDPVPRLREKLAVAHSRHGDDDEEEEEEKERHRDRRRVNEEEKGLKKERKNEKNETTSTHVLLILKIPLSGSFSFTLELTSCSDLAGFSHVYVSHVLRIVEYTPVCDRS